MLWAVSESTGPGSTSVTESIPHSAEHLLSLVYEELRVLASQKMGAKIQVKHFKQRRSYMKRGCDWVVISSLPGKTALTFSRQRRRRCGGFSWTMPGAKMPSATAEKWIA
jgi:hypothetical protein